MSKKDIFDKAVYTVGLAASTKNLEEGLKNSDAASSLEAAIPGPKQLGHADSICFLVYWAFMNLRR